MSITIEDILSDIRTKQSTKIYFSEFCLWWTHLESDLQQSTQRGREYRKAIGQKNGAAIMNLLTETDPLGNPVKVFDKPGRWVRQSIMNPGHFGKHGVKAFLKTHHQNCSTYFSNRFQGYNDLIDQKGQ